MKNKFKFKFFFKQLISLKENILNNKKIFKFNKKKWEKFLQYEKKKLKRYKKFKPKDQTQYLVSRYPNKTNSYKKRYKTNLITTKKFRLFYGNPSKKYVKKQINYILNKKINKNLNFKLLLLEIFEKRLDIILYRSKFALSLRNAKQLISHGKVFVNKVHVKTPSYKLKPGDLISINPKFYTLVEQNIKNSQTWPIPPKYLIINYKTLEIINHSDISKINNSTTFRSHLNIEKVLFNYSFLN